MPIGVVATVAAKWAMLGAAVMLAGIANAAEIKVIGSPGTRAPYTPVSYTHLTLPTTPFV